MEHVIHDYETGTLTCRYCRWERYMTRYQMSNPYEGLRLKREFAEEHAGCIEYKGNPRLARTAFKVKLHARLRSQKSLVERILSKRRTIAA